MSTLTNLSLGVIKGARPVTNEEGISTGQVSGVFDVQVGGQLKRGVPICSSTYNFKTNQGLLRLPEDDELVLVGKTEEGYHFILASVLPVSHENSVYESLPMVGQMSRHLERGEMLILGRHTKFPDETSYMLMDKSGSIELFSGHGKMVLGGDGSATLRAFTFTINTESGYERWGAHPLITRSYPAGVKGPAEWERLVRTLESDNLSAFVLTREGDIVAPGEDFIVKIDAIISYKNYNNQAAVIVRKNGEYLIKTGLSGPSLAKAPMTEAAIERVPVQISQSIRMSPKDKKISIDAMNVVIGDKITGNTVNIKGANIVISGDSIRVSAKSPVVVEAPQGVIINSNVTIMGSLTLRDGLVSSGPITSSGPVFTPTLFAPLQIGENVPDR